MTGRRVISERPRSPCTTPLIQVRYWARKGRSRPSSWRARVRASGVGAAAWSSCMITASPGRMRTSEKITRDTSHSTSSPCRTRRVMYVRMASQPAGREPPAAYSANLSNLRAGALSVSHAVLASYEQ